jgi:hypothetical protein
MASAPMLVTVAAATRALSEFASDMVAGLSGSGQKKFSRIHCGVGPCVTSTKASGRTHLAKAACTSLALS